MKKLGKLISGTAIMFLLTGTAHAVTLITPPLPPFGNVRFECEIVNVSAVALSVKMEVWGGSNNRLGQSSTFVLRPGFTGLTGALVSDNPRYCKFIVSGNNKLVVRATAYLVDSNTGQITAVVVAE